MAFVVTKINLDQLSMGTGTFTYEPDNITMTLRGYDNRQFQRAQELIFAREKEEAEVIKNSTMDDSFLDNINSEDKSSAEMITRAVAKFLIISWDVVDENGDLLEVNGDNLLMLTAGVTDTQQFTEWLWTSTLKVSTDHDKAITNTKKKPSPATSGKKSTKTLPTSKKP